MRRHLQIPITGMRCHRFPWNSKKIEEDPSFFNRQDANLFYLYSNDLFSHIHPLLFDDVPLLLFVADSSPKTTVLEIRMVATPLPPSPCSLMNANSLQATLREVRLRESKGR
jgi:hypothetical protein